MPDEGLLRDREVAELMNCSVYTVWREAKLGKLRSVRVGRLLRFKRSDVEAYIDAQTEGDGTGRAPTTIGGPKPKGKATSTRPKRAS
jgi:excisionase family DNA binding protein